MQGRRALLVWDSAASRDAKRLPGPLPLPLNAMPCSQDAPRACVSGQQPQRYRLQ